MGKWSKAAKLVSGVRDGLALLDDDERRRAIEALRSIVYEDMFGAGSQELPADDMRSETERMLDSLEQLLDILIKDRVEIDADAI